MDGTTPPESVKDPFVQIIVQEALRCRFKIYNRESMNAEMEGKHLTSHKGCITFFTLLGGLVSVASGDASCVERLQREVSNVLMSAINPWNEYIVQRAKRRWSSMR